MCIVVQISMSEGQFKSPTIAAYSELGQEAIKI